MVTNGAAASDHPSLMTIGMQPAWHMGAAVQARIAIPFQNFEKLSPYLFLKALNSDDDWGTASLVAYHEGNGGPSARVCCGGKVILTCIPCPGYVRKQTYSRVDVFGDADREGALGVWRAMDH